MDLGLSLSLGSLVGGTPTPTPTAATLIYDATAKQFVVTNAASFPGAVWAWEDETGTVVAGQTGSTLALAAAPAGLYVQAIPDGVTASASNFALAPLDLPAFIEAFDAADGTNLDGYNGWTSRGWSGSGWLPEPQSSFKINGSLLQAVSTSNGNDWVNEGAPAGSKRLILSNYVDADGANNEAKAYRTMAINASSNRSTAITANVYWNGFLISRKGTNDASGVTLINSVGGGSGVSLATTEIVFEILDGRIRAYADNIECPASVAAGGWDVSDVPETGRIALSGTGTAGSFPYDWAQKLEVQTILSGAAHISAVSTIAPSAGHASGQLSVTGTCGSSITAFDWSIIDAQGRSLTDWTSNVAVTSAGNWSILTDLAAAFAGRNDCSLAWRVSGDASKLSVMPLGQIGVYDAIDPLALGMNSVTVSNFAGSDIVRDRGRLGRWRYYNSGSGATMMIPDADYSAEGWPIAAIPGGFDCYSYLPFEGAPPGIRTGEWQVTISTPATINTHSLTNMNKSAVTSTSLKLTTVNPALGQTAVVDISGITATPAAPLTLSCMLTSETAPAGDLVTPDLAGIWHKDLFGGAFWWRDMKDSGAENSGVGHKPIGFAATAPFAASMTKQLGAGFHHCVQWDDQVSRRASVGQWITDFKNLASSTALAAGEIGNEIWNTDYNVQMDGLIWSAANKGHVPGVTPAFDGAILNDRANVDPQTGVTSRAFNPGEVFYCRTVDPNNLSKNWQSTIVQVTSGSTIAAGAAVPNTGSANGFTVLADSSNCIKGMRRYQGVLQADLGVLGKSILGDRFVSVLGAFLNDSIASIIDALLYQDNWKHIDFWSPSFYAGAGVNYGTLPWHDKHTSDFPTFKTGFFARWNAETDSMIAKLVVLKHGVLAGLIAAGVPRDQCPRMGHLYEGGDHNTIGAVPVDQRAGVVAAVNACVADALAGTATSYELTQLETKVGGVCVWFDDTEKPFWNNGANQVQQFGIRSYQFDGPWNSNGAIEQRYLAARSVLGGGV